MENETGCPDLIKSEHLILTSLLLLFGLAVILNLCNNTQSTVTLRFWKEGLLFWQLQLLYAKRYASRIHKRMEHSLYGKTSWWRRIVFHSYSYSWSMVQSLILEDRKNDLLRCISFYIPYNFLDCHRRVLVYIHLKVKWMKVARSTR